MYSERLHFPAYIQLLQEDLHTTYNLSVLYGYIHTFIASLETITFCFYHFFSL
jgi:hypothetical protein